MVGNPKRFEVTLRSSSSYKLKVDVTKDDCNREQTPHWHLCKDGERIGQINIYANWTSEPDVSSKIRLEAEDLTIKYSKEIGEIYAYNRVNGAGVN